MGKKKKSTDSLVGIKTVIVNKVARRNYEIGQCLEAGLSLVGSEVKSLREAGVNIKESYIKMKNSEAYLVGCHINIYTRARQGHEPLRERKLLLHKRELEKLDAQVREKGLTLVPMKIYFKMGRAKLEIGVGRGKKLFDKREDMKAKDAQIEMARSIKQRG